MLKLPLVGSFPGIYQGCERLMGTSTPIDPVTFALWGTQGGGLARWDEDRQTYVWHELPDWYATSGITEKVGDPIPRDWDLIPANEAACNEMFSEDEGNFP